MIINKLVFPIKADLSFVEGGIPQGKLTANSINRDILYVISPAVKETVITAFFQNQKQTEETQQATFVLSDLSIDYLVSKDTSYYELVKDWNVWQTTIPSKALEFISYNRAGKIGISFAFRQLLEPSGYEGSQEIKSDDFEITNSGNYIIKIPYYNFLGIDFTYNDVLIYNGGNEVYRKPAIALQGTTGTLEYSVDPSVYKGGYEDIDISLTESILTKLQSLDGEAKDLDTRVKANADNIALKVNTSDIVDDLVSTDVDKPLSANQGKVLNDKKVDKITEAQRDSLGFMENDDRIVPGVDGNLNEMPIKASILKEKNTIVMRDSDGIFQDLVEHNTSQGAHQDIRNMIAALQGGIIPRGVLQYTSNDIRYDKTILDTHIQNNYSREAQLGDMVRDSENIEWYYNGEFWDELGPYSLIPLASMYNDGLMSNIDYQILSQLEADTAFYYNTHGIPVKIKFKKFQLAAGQTMDDALPTLPVIDYEAEGGYIPIIRYTFYDSDGNIVGESMGKKPITTGSGGAGLTPEQEAKLDIIKDDGDGTKFLADDGTYKEVGGGSIDEVDGATTPIMLKTGSQETLDEDDTLKERELVYSSDKNIFGIYYDNQIRWQGVPLVVEPIIRVRNFGASDSKLSYVGMSPTVKLFQNGDINYYTNDIFDTMYPFRDMKEVEDELGNKFIEIPPFYVKYIVDENNIITGYDIANYKVDEDYGISQAFIDVISGEVKPLWFGKYMAHVDGSNKMTSKSGVMATAEQTLAWFRQMAINNGLGYYQNSIYTWQIVQMLMWTYFGSINSDDFFPDIDYGSYLENGSMDNVPYKVAYDSTTGKNTFFGIENILKEKRHFIDGVLLNSPNMYVAKDFRKFATDTTTNYDLVSTSLPTASSGYIVSMAYENGVMYPKVITGGSSGTYFADYYYQETGYRILLGGSPRDSIAAFGLSYWNGNNDSSSTYTNLGSRLMYSPLTPTE